MRGRLISHIAALAFVMAPRLVHAGEVATDTPTAHAPEWADKRPEPWMAAYEGKRAERLRPAPYALKNRVYGLNITVPALLDAFRDGASAETPFAAGIGIETRIARRLSDSFTLGVVVGFHAFAGPKTRTAAGGSREGSGNAGVFLGEIAYHYVWADGVVPYVAMSGGGSTSHDCQRASLTCASHQFGV